MLTSLTRSFFDVVELSPYTDLVFCMMALIIKLFYYSEIGSGGSY